MRETCDELTAHSSFAYLKLGPTQHPIFEYMLHPILTPMLHISQAQRRSYILLQRLIHPLRLTVKPSQGLAGLDNISPRIKSPVPYPSVLETSMPTSTIIISDRLLGQI